MTKLQIDLLRHGETTLSHTLRGHLDDDLTEQGWLQMQSTIQQYMTTPVDWDVIISSPLRRCRCFAEHLANQLGLPMRVNEHIKEMYFGDWEGISTQAIYEAEPEQLANFWQFPTQYHAPKAGSKADRHFFSPGNNYFLPGMNGDKQRYFMLVLKSYPCRSIMGIMVTCSLYKKLPKP